MEVAVKDDEKEGSQNDDIDEEEVLVGVDAGGLRRFPRLGSAAAAAERRPSHVFPPAPLGSEVSRQFRLLQRPVL